MSNVIFAHVYLESFSRSAKIEHAAAPGSGSCFNAFPTISEIACVHLAQQRCPEMAQSLTRIIAACWSGESKTPGLSQRNLGERKVFLSCRKSGVPMA